MVYELRRRRVDLKIQREPTTSNTLPQQKKGSFFLVDPSPTNSAKKVEISQNFDHSFCVRVLNRSLSPQEETEWVKKTCYQMEIQSGVLQLGTNTLPEETDPQKSNPFLVEVQIPQGQYVITVYEFYHRLLLVDRYLESISNPETPDSFLPLGDWFRKSYPGRMFPPWLYILCTSYPALDPTHIKEWINLPKFKMRPFEEVVSYLIHLSASEQDFVEPMKRMPEKCPMGIPAKPVNEN